MRSLTSIFLCLVLIAAAAPAAGAYHLSPTNIKAKLRGTLTFYPGGQPVVCNVAFDLKIIKHGASIVSINLIHDPNCGDLNFAELPWTVGITGAHSGLFGTVVYTGAGGGCSEGAEGFTENYTGVWKLSGQCITGHLTSYPTITIVK